VSAPHPPLDEAVLGPDPVVAFRRWFDEAGVAGVPVPEAMALATASRDGRPSLRWVLLKGVEAPCRFLFFTSYQSRKGTEIARNPEGALAFYWAPLERQVRIEGPIVTLDAKESDAYWVTRARASQIAATVSQQSRPVTDRATMERAYAALEARAPAVLPRPPHWGGYALVARAIEFWQGQPGRFHDRLRYEHERTASPWTVTRLWP
jgi:pyridoxamine 5'-phosphate oxidase